jgi:hypothetical protein
VLPSVVGAFERAVPQRRATSPMGTGEVFKLEQFLSGRCSTIQRDM